MIDRLQPYPDYKDSGQPWLGRVPGHWSVMPNRALFSEVKDREHPDEEMLSVTITRGIVRQRALLDGSSKKDSSNLDKSKYKLIQPGDIAYNKMRAWQGALGASELSGIISPAYVVMRLRRDVNLPRYYHHLYRTPHFAKEAERWSYGITSDMWSLRPEHFKLIYTPEPPPDEQSAIVKYLDWANGRLERAIRAKRKIIALLNEQKQAIIHRAVTRGLDPNVKLKPSGIPWLGDIPEHWEIMRLKRLGGVKIGLTYSPGDMVDETGMLVLRASNVRNGVIVSADNVYVSKKVPEALLVREGDILICVRSGSRNLVGKSALITSEVAGVTYGAFMSLLRSKTNPFLFWVLNSNLFACVMAEFETSTINQLTQSDLKNLFIPVPPASEQAKIVAHLQSATSDVDRAISRLEREITLLREYRTRLVADVVTGKLDVREAAKDLPDEAVEPEVAPDAEDLSESEPEEVEA